MTMLASFGVRPINATFLVNNHYLLSKVRLTFCRNVSKKAYKNGMDRRPVPKIDATAQSLAAKGFLRPCKSYQPPENYKDVIRQISSKILGNDKTNSLREDQKCQILIAASQALSHSVPNSLLHQIETLDDVLQFYGTAVDSRTPLDRLRHVELPENLHIQFDYKRWHPENDDKFGGITAFPESSTLITGLRYRKKYQGHRQDVKVLRE